MGNSRDNLQAPYMGVILLNLRFSHYKLCNENFAGYSCKRTATFPVLFHSWDLVNKKLRRTARAFTYLRLSIWPVIFIIPSPWYLFNTTHFLTWFTLGLVSTKFTSNLGAIQSKLLRDFFKKNLCYYLSHFPTWSGSSVQGTGRGPRLKK